MCVTIVVNDVRERERERDRERERQREREVCACALPCVHLGILHVVHIYF